MYSYMKIHLKILTLIPFRQFLFLIESSRLKIQLNLARNMKRNKKNYFVSLFLRTKLRHIFNLADSIGWFGRVAALEQEKYFIFCKLHCRNANSSFMIICNTLIFINSLLLLFANCKKINSIFSNSPNCTIYRFYFKKVTNNK